MAPMPRGTTLGFPLFILFALLLATASPAPGADKFCSDPPYFGVIDGSRFPDPVQITIDRDCTFRNFPQSDPLTSTINFQTNDNSIYLIIFDNVYYTGNMACSNIDHRIWFSNSSYYGSNNACQDLFIPIEKIDKQSPAPYAAIGVPFTYTLTIPVQFDPATGGVITASGSINDLHSVTIRDDLNATGAALTYVSHVARWAGSNTPVQHTFSNAGGLLTFDISPIIPAERQIVIEITVVLNDTPANVPGTVFTNTATWDFGRLIDGEYYEPLPGERGVSAPMTIVGPDLVVNKTSSETALNLGVWTTYTIDVQNAGGGDAWNTTIPDVIPVGMCATDPTAALSARIVQADGATLVRTLAPGADYTVSPSPYTGGCRIALTMTDAGGPIAPGQHLIITYRSQLDAGVMQDNLALTNVAGATRWFSGDSSFTGRRQYDRTLTDGTPGVVDFQDSETVTTALTGYYFQKTVQNLTSGANPATTAVPGDRLRYRLRLFNVDQTISGITIGDLLDPNSFDPATFAMVSIVAPPPAAATYGYDPATGQLQIRGDGSPLNVPVGGELLIEFDITLRSTLAIGTAVNNQATLSATGLTALSDDPYVNGIAPPGAPADPTTVVIQTPGALSKANTRGSATIGEQFTYRITVPATPTAVPLYDVRILDDLGLSAANVRFVGANVVSGGAWSLGNSGTSTSLVLEDLAAGIDIPANTQAVIEITVALQNTLANQSGLPFHNSASYTYNRMNGNDATRTAGGAGITGDMTVVEPALTSTKRARYAVPAGKASTDPAAMNDVLEYAITVVNNGGSTAFDTNVVDTLPPAVTLVPGSATALIDGVAVTGFVADPGTSGGSLVWGRQNGDGTLDIPAGQSLVLTYRVSVVSVNGLPITNSVYVDWTSLQGAGSEERTGAGCPNIAAPNDYCYGPATSAVSTVDTTTIVKSVVSDSWNSGLSTGTDAILRVGDTAVYRLALTLREGQLQNVVVADTLPAGLAFDNVVSINGDTSAPFSAAAPFTHAAFTAPAVSGGIVTWSLGDITNAVNNNTSDDTFVIEYRARVMKDTLAHTPTTTLANTVVLSYTGSDPAAARLRSSIGLAVLQPIMTAPAKSATGFTSPASVNVVTDVMPFHLETCNATGLAPAYSVRLTDQLATQLNETTITTPQVRVGGTLLTAGTDYTYAPPAGRGGTMTFVLTAPVNPGQCATIDYSIGFHTDFGPNQTWTNNVTLDEYWSLQTPTATGQMYGPLGPAVFTMTNSATIISPIKTLSSPAGNEATIGEVVVYRILVPGTVSNAALFDVVVADTLHPSLVYVGATANVGFTNNTAGNNVSLVVPQIPAGQQAEILLTARVGNNNGANAGVSFANSASYTYATSPGGAPISGGSDATDTPLTIVEPAVAVIKGVTPDTPPSAGDILTYTLTLPASGGAAGDIHSNAYDVSIADTLSLGLAYVPGSATVAGAAINPAITGDGIGTRQVLTWNTGLDIPEGTASTVTYQVRVLGGVGANQILRNDVRVEWTGLDGVNANERTGSGTPAYNDYFATAFTTLTTPVPGALRKENPAQLTVAIGQPFTYRITVPDAALTTALYDVRIIDTLPAGAQFVAVNKVSTGGTWIPVAAVSGNTLTITGTDTGIDIPAGQQAVVEVTLVLNDDTTVNYSGRTFTNTATYTYDPVNDIGPPATTGNVTTNPPMTIVGPDTLTLDKSGPTQMRPGVPGTFTLDVYNAGTGTAWGVTVTDRLPNPTPGGMCDAAPTNVTAQLYLADGTTTVGGPLAAGSDFTVTFTGVPTCTFNITMRSPAGAVPANHRLIVTYQAVLDVDNVNGVPLVNVAGATRWYGIDPSPGVTPRTYTRLLTDGTVGTLDHEDAHSVMPVIPVNGVVYDSLSRRPIAGARVTMLRASTGMPLPDTCFPSTGTGRQNQLTDAYGQYTFELNFGDAQCPPGADYLVAVTAAPAAYDTSAPSRIIPPATSAATAPYSVPLCPADAVPATTDRCEAQASPFAPTGAAATTYYLHLTLSNDRVPRDSQIFNNHIPVDPRLDATIAVTKKSSVINVTRGQLVPYTITVRNNRGGGLDNMAIIDRVPPGFKYVAGSSRYDGNPLEPVIAGNGTELRWENRDLGYNVTHTIKLLLVVSSGVGEGEYVNRALVRSNLAGDSAVATATVRVSPDPDFDCTDVIGKVFDDANLNGAQDPGEKGLFGVRVVTARGLIASTDNNGRFHITCAVVPDEDRGSNFILKLDERSLPSGYRLTTENPRVQRATRGKMLRFGFGATIHRVVRMEIADGAFEPGTTEIRMQWTHRIDRLLGELGKGPSVLRLSYLGDVEPKALALERVEALKREITARWKQSGAGYQLTIETEIFWRRGAPVAGHR